MKRRRNPDNWTRIGEWWIDDSGNALYADADVGDMGHEAYVIDSLTRRLLYACGVECCDEHAGNLYDRENKKLISAQMKEEGFDGTIEEFVDDAAKRIWKDPKQREDALRICEGHGDARKYGMQYDGWIRVAGHGFECWEMNATVLKHMGDGIYDAGVEDVGDDEIFEIYVHKTQMHYTDVPWSVINGGDPGALRVYGTKNNPMRRHYDFSKGQRNKYAGRLNQPRVLSYAEAHRWEPLAKARGVSAVARSERGFMRMYQRAGTWDNVNDYWRRRRAAFIARHMAQGRHETLWKRDRSGKLQPSRRCLALLMWAYKS